MGKDMLLQVVCFETGIGPGEFTQHWEKFMSGTRRKGGQTDVLYKAVTKARFTYISQHEWPQDDFQFVFNKDKQQTERLRESRIKVVQAGGYIQLKKEYKQTNDDDLVRIIVFSAKSETDIPAFEELQPHTYLNIYQAYYESSVYPYIFEYFATEGDAVLLQQELKKQFTGIETAIYKECLLTVA